MSDVTDKLFKFANMNHTGFDQTTLLQAAGIYGLLLDMLSLFKFANMNRTGTERKTSVPRTYVII
jgi:hypothetical protein